MTETTESAVTAAELDELPNEFEELANRFPEINPSNYDHDDACALNTWGCEAAGALRDAASLRKQLDEARAGHHLHDALRRQGETIAELMADNAKKNAALRKIAALDYKNAATNMAAYKAVQIATDALTPASQEADHVADAGKMVPASQEAPAPAISGGDMVSVPRDALQTLIEQADAMAFERNTQDYEHFGRPQYIEEAYGWLNARAALAAAGQKP